MKPGCLHVYTGDGKGKTTAALGLILRACGAGKRVFLAQFLKHDNTSEVRLLRDRFPDVTVETFGATGWIRGEPTPADRTAARRGWDRVCAAARSGAYDLMVCDEINLALHYELIALPEILALVNGRSAGIEFVLTGRNAPQALLEQADLVTEMRCIRHYQARGVTARRGIEH